jgi:hypothetical protein
MEPTPETNAARDEARVYDDVRVLLEFLGQRADSLLQSHFDDTRGDLAAPARRLASPPCKSYKHFLSRLASIGRRFSSPDNDEPPSTRLGPVAAIRVGSGEAIRVGPFDEDDLSDPAFLSFSRDFLAAVAAPATVDSIRVTRAYVYARRHSLWWRLIRWRPVPVISADRAAAPQAACDESVTAGARRLASRVVITEYSAMLMTLFTLVVSAYALSGQKILDSRQHIFNDYQQISLDVATLDKDWLAMQPADIDPNAPPPLCAPGNATVRAARSVGIKVAEATTATRTDAVTGSMGAAPAADASASPAVIAHQCTLYWKRKRTNEDMTAVTLHLVSWTQVVLQWHPLGSVFGIDNSFIEASASLHEDWCKSLGYSTGTDCERSLQDLIYHTPEVANSLLGCIALYVLPTLYGFLGAAASVLRALRRKVELSLVTMTDRGRVQQDLILGLLCGAIMGLFAGYIGKAEAATGLGLSALALLAGYNVTDTLAFLDELCHRIFQPSKTGNA